MSCDGPVTAWRTPADVRPTPGACVPSFVRAPAARRSEKCLRDATRPVGSRLRYTLPSSSAPLGCGSSASKRLWRCLVAPSVRLGRSAPPRTPRSRFWSRMPLTLKAGGALAPRAYKPSPFGKTDSRHDGRLARWSALARRGGRATWLILPVVICLSQRLSHACASMN